MSKNKTKQKAQSFNTTVTLPTGERVYIRANSKEEREKKKQEIKMSASMGVEVCNNARFEDFAELWLTAYKKPKLRESSYALVKHNTVTHVIPFFRGMLIKEIKPLHIQLFLGELRSKNLSKSVQGKCLQHAKSIFTAAEDNGLIAKSPVSKLDRAGGEDTTEEEPLSNEQAKRLLEAVYGTRAYGFCLIALTTGMRRGEILGLMWEDIDLETGVIEVRHNKAFLVNKNDAPVTTMLKTEAANRRLPIPGPLMNWLVQEKQSSKSPYVLSMANGASLTKASFRKLWELVTVRTASDDRELGSLVQGSKHGRVEVTLDFDCHPHLLRHTYITQLFEAGLDLKQVQYLAGHSKPEMTLRVYTHYRRRSRETETAVKVSDAMKYLSA
jgi:integrase